MSSVALYVNQNAKTYYLEPGRPLSGGVLGTQLGGLFTAIVNSTNGVLPFVTVAVANAGTVALSSAVAINVLRTTSDGTISGAVINLPTTGPTGGALVDGQTVALSTTGAITTVTGTIQSGSVLPVVSTLAAGAVVKLRYNLAATTWFRT